MNFWEVIKKRRTHREFNGAPLSREQLRLLLGAAILAPNHKRNQPWRFTVIEAPAIKNFWQALESQVRAGTAPEQLTDSERKLQKLAEKLPTLGGIVHVSVLLDPDPRRERENYAAACCAVQNLLLAATAEGLGSFWSTNAIFASHACQEILGLGNNEAFVGSIWLGKVSDSPDPPGFTLDSVMKFWP